MFAEMGFFEEQLWKSGFMLSATLVMLLIFVWKAPGAALGIVKLFFGGGKR